MILGIHALRSGSGGAINHIIQLLSHQDLWRDSKIDKIILFTNNVVAKQIPTYPFLDCIVPPTPFNKGFLSYFYEIFALPSEARAKEVDVMLYTDASVTLSNIPSLVMSRDMLSFERGIKFLYSGLPRLRIEIIGWLQKNALSKATKPIFLNEYAKNTICPDLENYVIIPHGFESRHVKCRQDIIPPERGLKLCYTSNTAPYKGHFELILAFKEYLRVDPEAELHLIGAKSGTEYLKISELVGSLKLQNSIHFYNFTDHSHLFQMYAKMDAFIFCSKCENMPNTLIEAVKSGIPTISSNRGPMKSLLSNYEYQFDPYNSESILFALLNFRENFERQQYDYLMSQFSTFDWRTTTQLTIEACEDCVPRKKLSSWTNHTTQN